MPGLGGGDCGGDRIDLELAISADQALAELDRREVAHLSRPTALTMVFRLCQSAQQRWRRLDGPGRLAEVVRGVRFVNGERQISDAA